MNFRRGTVRFSTKMVTEMTKMKLSEFFFSIYIKSKTAAAAAPKYDSALKNDFAPQYDSALENDSAPECDSAPEYDFDQNL